MRPAGDKLYVGLMAGAAPLPSHWRQSSGHGRQTCGGFWECSTLVVAMSAFSSPSA